MPTNTDRKLRVFLCHASQDKPIVRELYQRLNAEGWIDPWLDEEKLLPGQDWDMEINRALRNTDSIIICLSDNAIAKEVYIQKEIRRALDIADEKPKGTIFVIPIRFDDCRPPDGLTSWQYVDYFPKENKNKGYERLLASLRIRKEKINPIQSDFFDGAFKILPKPVQEAIKKEVGILNELLNNNRPPRIMIIGQRGAGKSSLVNAIFRQKVADVGDVLSKTGVAVWYEYQIERGGMQILDTRGLGDSTRPETANFQYAIDDIKAAIDNICPDVILFLCRAKDVDRYIQHDLKIYAEIHSYIYDRHKYDSPVVAVVNQVDELAPVRIVDPPYADDKKQINIHIAANHVKNQMLAANIDSIKVIPTSTYAEYDEKDGKIITYSRFWNIDELVRYLIEMLPNEAQVELARLGRIRDIQIKLSDQIITTTAIICGTIAVIPIPIADILPITSTQISMIIGIAYIGGKKFTIQTARDFLVALGANIGAAYVLREVASALSKFVFPVGGGIVSAGIAAAGTWAIGEAAVAYFIEEKSIEEAKEIFKNVKKNRENINS